MYGPGAIAQSMVNPNHWLRSIETNTFSIIDYIKASIKLYNAKALFIESKKIDLSSKYKFKL